MLGPESYNAYVWLNFRNDIVIYILTFNLPIDLVRGHRSHAITILTTAIVTTSLLRVPRGVSSLRFFFLSLSLSPSFLASFS